MGVGALLGAGSQGQFASIDDFARHSRDVLGMKSIVGEAEARKKTAQDEETKRDAERARRRGGRRGTILTSQEGLEDVLGIVQRPRAISTFNES